MKRGLVLVEGQTEEQVVNDVLAPHFLTKGLALTPTLVKTKRVVGGADFKGGVLRYAQVQGDLARLLHDTDVTVVTTMIDYYALPQDFPGMRDRPPSDPRGRVAHVEAAWAAEVGDMRFVPHLVLHELEAWVFAAPECLEPWMFDDDDGVIRAIAEIAAAHATPEDIDEDVRTAPSKRLAKTFASYQKTLHGPVAVASIGIERIRHTCPHVAQWLGRLEAFASAP